MLKLYILNNAVVPWPVKLTLPASQPAEQDVDLSFTAHFHILPDAEVATLGKQSDQALLDRVLVGWDGVEDETGPLPCTLDNIARLTAYSGLRVKLIGAYFECLSGALRKN